MSKTIYNAGKNDGRLEGRREGRRSEVIVLDKSSEAGQVMEAYLGMDERRQQRLLGYMKALSK